MRQSCARIRRRRQTKNEDRDRAGQKTESEREGERKHTHRISNIHREDARCLGQIGNNNGIRGAAAAATKTPHIRTGNRTTFLTNSNTYENI